MGIMRNGYNHSVKIDYAITKNKEKDFKNKEEKL